MRTASIRCAVLLLLIGCSGAEGNESRLNDGGVDNDGVDAAGSDGDFSVSPRKSGSRLRMRIANADDGARAFLGWFDSERMERCAFRQADDGELRCLTDAPVANPFYPPEQTYSDANCTRPGVVISIPRCNEFTTNTALLSDSTCSLDGDGRQFRVFRLAPSPLNNLWMVSDGKEGAICQPFAVSSGLYFEVLEEVDASAFVAATEVVD